MYACVCMYVCMCASIAPEELDGFYSYLLYKSLSTLGWRPVTMNVLAPKIGVPNENGPNDFD
jgi:hypothetical protein